MIAIQLRTGGCIEIGTNHTRIRLVSGAEVYGEPQGTEEQARTAQELGCDIVDMVRCHDPLHMLLTDLLGVESYSLRYAAGELAKDDYRLAEAEEHAVMALQRFIVALRLDVPEIAWRNGYEIA